MRTIEKAPASVGALDEAGMETSGRSIPINKDTTEEPKKQGKIADMLPRGERNAIPAKELAALVGAPSVRALQSMIARECEETDALILSTVRHGGGYFTPQRGEAGRKEIEAFIKTLDARARHTFLRLRAARRALRQIDGQLEIEVSADE